MASISQLRFPEGLAGRDAALWHLAALAEVFDFPPLLGYLDSHALWHCGTPHCVWLWYRFLREDLRWDGGRAVAKTKKEQ